MNQPLIQNETYERFFIDSLRPIMKYFFTAAFLLLFNSAFDYPIDGGMYKGYLSNAGRTFATPHGNEITARMIFFIDYLKLKRKKVLQQELKN